MKKINCHRHGAQGFGLVCTHVAHAIDKNQQVGFFWGDDIDLARPDAWCKSCEKRLIALKGASSEQWFIECEYKMLCAKCWDEAKLVCGGYK